MLSHLRCRPWYALAVLGVCAGLSACEEEPAEELGEAVEETGEEAGDVIEDAGEEAEVD